MRTLKAPIKPHKATQRARSCRPTGIYIVDFRSQRSPDHSTSGTFGGRGGPRCCSRSATSLSQRRGGQAGPHFQAERPADGGRCVSPANHSGQNGARIITVVTQGPRLLLISCFSKQFTVIDHSDELVILIEETLAMVCPK